MSSNVIIALIIVSVIPSWILSWLAVGWIQRHAARLGLLDKPNARKVHTTPIPLGGGLGIWFGVVSVFALGTLAITLCSWFPDLASRSLPESFAIYIPGLMSRVGSIWFLIGGGTIVMVLGLMDDRFGLDWKLRLGVEFGVAAAVVYGLNLHLTAYIDIPWLTSLLSVVWIVMLINSFNMLDNMDALSGGVAAIVCAMLSVMLLSTSESSKGQPQLFVAAMMLTLLGGLLGFLKHNWPPAKIFMGDAGSYFVGYWIAVSTLLSTYAGTKGSAPHAVLAPLCLLAIPLYDMISVISIRLSEGRSPFQADKKHFSHRLVELGMSKKQAVGTIYLATLTCSLGALILPRTDWVGAGIVIAIVLAMLALIGLLESLTAGPKA
ncbi:MAG: undecaprenyl/decaprenyl-phosphate alpha-N-acetylglucosaminyl 1-phosphate transferase [Planctomycetes bacterium]|nr:undecaprenyl/decaprenyl-phosphate alpha-N-acetylglucosaminyl 1-phosphate transferase [Planctomycetota bacterium]